MISFFLINAAEAGPLKGKSKVNIILRTVED